MRPNRLSNIKKSSINTVLFVNATIGFSENLFLVIEVRIIRNILYFEFIFVQNGVRLVVRMAQ